LPASCACSSAPRSAWEVFPRWSGKSRYPCNGRIEQGGNGFQTVLRGGNANGPPETVPVAGDPKGQVHPCWPPYPPRTPTERVSQQSTPGRAWEATAAAPPRSSDVLVAVGGRPWPRRA